LRKQVITVAPDPEVGL